MISVKRILLIVLVVLGCAREDRTVVTFWHVMSGPLGRQLDEFVAEFNRLYPEGEVRSVHMGSYDVLAQKLMGAVASGTPPVIAQLYESWTDQFYRAGDLHPLESFIAVDTGFARDDFYPVFLEDNTYDSILVTLPFNKSIPVFYYNQDIFEQFDIREFPETWNEFRTVCQTLKLSGLWPTSWPVDVWYFSTMLYQHEGCLLDETTRAPRFHEKEGIQALRYLVGLIQDSLLYINPGFQRQIEFLAGNVVIIPASVTSWAFMKEQLPFRMAVAPFPHGTQRATVIAGTNIGMFKGSTDAQRQHAWKFIRWLLLPENQVRWTRATYYLPTRMSVTHLIAYKEFAKRNKGYDKIVEQLWIARTEPRTEEWFTGRMYLGEALEEAVRLQRTPQQALEHAARRLLVELY
jgi:sn-glycerol 3-phosphate transport system substrate-binding protein